MVQNQRLNEDEQPSEVENGKVMGMYCKGLQGGLLFQILANQGVTPARRTIMAHKWFDQVELS